MQRAVLRVLAWFVLVGLASLSAVAAGIGDPLDRPAAPTRLGPSSVLLDLTKAGNRLIAVGERGLILLSDDGGRMWRQAKVPTSISLTAVKFATPQQGWAVGHAGVVLHTEDGGESWIRQFDGRQAAQLALKAAQERIGRAPNDEAAKRQLADAERLVNDGPDKPFLDLYFFNDKTGFIVGAYGLMFRTEDGGQTWQSWMSRLDNSKGLHIYAIRAAGKTIYLAGEQGLFFRSTDGGNTFTKMETPYKGTFFSIALTRSGAVVLAGMRGNAYFSDNEGKTFQKCDVPVPVSFAAEMMLKDGSLLFVNQAGQLLISRDEGRTLTAIDAPPLPPAAAIAQVDDANLMLVGVAGAIRIPLPGAAAGRTGGMQ